VEGEVRIFRDLESVEETRGEKIEGRWWTGGLDV
jgi:hypothetical protein